MSNKEPLIIGSEEELRTQLLQDITELFKGYTYRFHPNVRPTTWKLSLYPYLDTAEGYIKNIPAQIIPLNEEESTTEATPDPDRFSKAELYGLMPDEPITEPESIKYIEDYTTDELQNMLDYYEDPIY